MAKQQMYCSQQELILQSKVFDRPHMGLMTLQRFFNITDIQRGFWLAVVVESFLGTPQHGKTPQYVGKRLFSLEEQQTTVEAE